MSLDAERFLKLAQKHVESKYSLYEQLAHLAWQKAEKPVTSNE